MAADSALPSISCPTSMVASCPPLLGFTPQDSVVAFVTGVPGRSSPVLVRVDLPSAEGVPGWAERIAASIAGTGGREAALVAWTDAPDEAQRVLLPSTAPLDVLAADLLEHGMGLLTVLSTNGRVYWSHDCPDDVCCAGAWPLDASVVAEVQAEYVYAGYAPLPTRADLAASLAPDMRRAPEVAQLLAGRRPVGALARWQDVELNYATWLLVPGGPRDTRRARTGAGDRLVGAPVPSRVAARMIHGLADLQVRDALLLRLIECSVRDQVAWQRSIDLLADVVRCAPPGQRAPSATLLGIVAWMTGEGSLSTVALQAAEADQPGYRLAALTAEVITRGTDPAVWRRSMRAGLTEAQCLGRQRPTRTSSGGSPGSPAP